MRTLAAIGALVGSAALADEANVVRLHAAHLDAPTEWCAADSGVPVIMSIDGPELFVSVPLAEQPSAVKVRRGGNEVQRVEVGRKDPTELVTRFGNEGTHSSTSTTSVNTRPSNVTPVGRLEAKVLVCQSMWPRERDQMSWRVVDADGNVAAEGDGELVRADQFGIFNTFRPHPQALRLGEHTFVVMAYPTFERTTEAFASLAQETQQ